MHHQNIIIIYIMRIPHSEKASRVISALSLSGVSNKFHFSQNVNVDELMQNEYHAELSHFRFSEISLDIVLWNINELVTNVEIMNSATS